MAIAYPLGLRTGAGRSLFGSTESKEIILSDQAFDEFVLECYSPGSGTFRLLLEYFTEESSLRNTRFRDSMTISPGLNSYRAGFTRFNLTKLTGYISVYPEVSEEERRLIFTWLDFVKYVDGGKRQEERTQNRKNVKVKCLGWDLDNTLWNGTLAESGSISIGAENIALIKE